MFSFVVLKRTAGKRFWIEIKVTKVRYEFWYGIFYSAHSATPFASKLYLTTLWEHLVTKKTIWYLALIILRDLFVIKYQKAERRGKVYPSLTFTHTKPHKFKETQMQDLVEILWERTGRLTQQFLLNWSSLRRRPRHLLSHTSVKRLKYLGKTIVMLCKTDGSAWLNPHCSSVNKKCTFSIFMHFP
jgi:hypothetical protein